MTTSLEEGVKGKRKDRKSWWGENWNGGWRKRKVWGTRHGTDCLECLGSVLFILFETGQSGDETNKGDTPRPHFRIEFLTTDFHHSNTYLLGNWSDSILDINGHAV